MTALDYILDGLEAELALERELGVRVFEVDRAVLAPPAGAAQPSPSVGAADCRGLVPRPRNDAAHDKAPLPVRETRDEAPLSARETRDKAPLPARHCEERSDAAIHDFVFLHEKPLSPKGVEMMAKIVAAMGKTAETAPVVHAAPLPRAKAYVVLGGLALRKWFPGRGASPGQWIRTDRGEPTLVTYSPEYVLRFATVTPAVKKIKQDMWLSLKDLMRRMAK